MPLSLLTDIIKHAKKSHPNRTALAMRTRYRSLEWTYAELFTFAENIGVFLHEQRVKPGDRVILWASNSPFWLGVFFGCLLRGVIVVPLHTQNTESFIQEVLRQTRAKLLFKSSDLELALDDIPCYDINFLEFETTKTILPLVSIKPNDVAEILYTSGTTGKPKGVMLTHRNITANINSVHDIIPISSRHRFLSILPLSHSFEQAVEFRVLLAGAFLAYSAGLHSGAIREALQTYKITTLATVPLFLKRIMQRVEEQAKNSGREKKLERLFEFGAKIPMRSWRRLFFYPIRRRFAKHLELVVSGGAALDAETAEKWRTLGVHVIQGYGLTETAPVVAILKPDDPKVDAVGQVVPDVNVRLSAEKEILVKGPNVTPGYWEAPERTREAFTQDGWFRTGDLGALDDDGHLYIMGRRKDMILTSSGQNVFPEDIEEIINQDPEVEESAVVGVEKNGDIQIHAALLSHTKDPESIRLRVNKQLSSFQKIQSISLWPFSDFPRTITRKLKHFKIQEYIQTHLFSKATARGQAHLSHIMHIIAEVSGQPIESLSDELTIESLGLSSLARIELVSRIEEELNTEIDEGKIKEDTTIAELQRWIEEKRTVKIKYRLPKWPRLKWIRALREVLYWVIVVPIAFTFTHVKVKGNRRLYALKGPVIFMPTHIHDLDGLYVYRAFNYHFRSRIAMASATDVLYQQYKYVQPLVTLLCHTFPLQRIGQTRLGFKYTGELIDEGWSILFFPQGGVRDADGPIVIKEGAAATAVEMRIPIVPIHLKKKTRYVLGFIPRFYVTVEFRRPVSFSPATDYKTAKHTIEKRLS